MDARSTTNDDTTTAHAREISIWWFAFAYFAAYAPYSALTSALSRGHLGPAVIGFSLLPIAVGASLLGMMTFLVVTGWWRSAGHRIAVGPWQLPAPRRLTLVSGSCTAAILMTTTLAYTFPGISIVFAMLLMRGGVLVIAPVVDALSRRKVSWTSWTALALALGALVVAFAEKGGFALSTPAAVDIGVYLAAYFVRLRLMSGAAKSSDPDANRRFFVEEQLVAAPLSLLVLVLWATLASGPVHDELVKGFLGFGNAQTAAIVFVIGLLSQGTGIAGGLILLDKRENTFCVPVNRASSILAGLVASLMLMIFVGAARPSNHELVGAGLIIAAIGVLSAPGVLQKLRARA